jgi:hypothetical protein
MDPLKHYLELLARECGTATWRVHFQEDRASAQIGDYSIEVVGVESCFGKYHYQVALLFTGCILKVLFASDRQHATNLLSGFVFNCRMWDQYDHTVFHHQKGMHISNQMGKVIIVKDNSGFTLSCKECDDLLKYLERWKYSEARSCTHELA